MSELSDESKALIASEAPLDEATPAEIAAMHARVTALLAAVPAPVPSTNPDPTALLGKAATKLKVAGAALAAGVGSGVLLLALSRPAPTPAALPSASAPRSAMPRPSLAPPAAPSAPTHVEPSAPAVSPEPPGARRRSSEPRAPAASSAGPSASEEALMVAAAEAQLRAGHAAAALALYERHLREYPQGALRHESQSGRVVALCGVGRGAEARAEIERLAARYPGLPGLRRMRRACGSEEP